MTSEYTSPHNVNVWYALWNYFWVTNYETFGICLQRGWELWHYYISLNKLTWEPFQLIQRSSIEHELNSRYTVYLEFSKDFLWFLLVCILSTSPQCLYQHLILQEVWLYEVLVLVALRTMLFHLLFGHI